MQLVFSRPFSLTTGVRALHLGTSSGVDKTMKHEASYKFKS